MYELCQHLNNRQCSIDEKLLTVAKYCRYIEDSMPDISVLNLNTINESVRVFKKISAEVLKDGLNGGRLITIYLLASEICSELNDDETMQIIKPCQLMKNSCAKNFPNVGVNWFMYRKTFY